MILISSPIVAPSLAFEDTDANIPLTNVVSNWELGNCHH
jgi:hypothetical protein